MATTKATTKSSYALPNPACRKCHGLHVNVLRRRREACPRCWGGAVIPKEYVVSYDDKAPATTSGRSSGSRGASSDKD